MKNFKKSDVLPLISTILIINFVGALSAVFSAPAVTEWLINLEKPALYPPNWIFGPVWTLLYTLMGIFAFLVWKKSFKHKYSQATRNTLQLFAFQLGLNFMWSIWFFGLQNPLAAFVDLLLLIVALSLTITTSFKFSKILGYLLIPYLLWVVFAGYLNLSIIVLN